MLFGHTPEQFIADFVTEIHFIGGKNNHVNAPINLHGGYRL